MLALQTQTSASREVLLKGVRKARAGAPERRVNEAGLAEAEVLIRGPRLAKLTL